MKSTHSNASVIGLGLERLLVGVVRMHCDARALVLVLNSTADDWAHCSDALAHEQVNHMINREFSAGIKIINGLSAATQVRDGGHGSR